MKTRFLIPLLAGVVSSAPLIAQHDQPIKVRIGYPTALHGQVAKAIDKAGLGPKNGLAPEFTFFQYGPPQIEGLATKSLDVAFTSLVPTASFLDKQAGAVKVIASLGSSVHGLLVQGDGDIKTVADLKGRSIGVAFGSDSYVDLLIALREAGLDPEKDVKLQNIPPNEQAVAFDQKLVDAVLTRPPQLGRLQKERGARLVKEWPHHLWVIARTEFLQQNPGVEEKLVAAIREGARYVAAHPQETAAWFAEDLRQKPEGIEAIARTNPLYQGSVEEITVVPSADLQAFADKRSQDLVSLGVTKKQVEFFKN